MIDPVTLAVLKGRLEQIADEMDATLFRSAFNPIIAEAHDAAHGLYHAETGDTLVQGLDDAGKDLSGGECSGGIVNQHASRRRHDRGQTVSNTRRPAVTARDHGDRGPVGIACHRGGRFFPTRWSDDDHVEVGTQGLQGCD
mgnify:CR=1 FL=1